MSQRCAKRKTLRLKKLVRFTYGKGLNLDNNRIEKEATNCIVATYKINKTKNT